MRRNQPYASREAGKGFYPGLTGCESQVGSTTQKTRLFSLLKLLGLLTLLVGGGLQACAVEGYKVIRRKKPKVRMGPKTRVVLFGVDKKAARRAPAVCKTLGEVEAWSLGEKTFPYTSFRRAARALGGNGVSGIRSTGHRDNRYYRRGLVVLCPVLPPPPPSHAVP